MVRLQCPHRLFADGFLPSGIYFALPVPAPSGGSASLEAGPASGLLVSLLPGCHVRLEVTFSLRNVGCSCQ